MQPRLNVVYYKEKFVERNRREKHNVFYWEHVGGISDTTDFDF